MTGDTCKHSSEDEKPDLDGLAGMEEAGVDMQTNKGATTSARSADPTPR